MKIRKLSEKDVEQESFFETLSALSDTVSDFNLKRRRDLFKKISSNPDLSIFVAEEKGEIVGTVTLLVEQKFIRNGGRVAHIEDVSVRKSMQGKGVGRKLMNHVIQQSKRAKCYKIILNCSEKNASFYKKLGFKVHEREMRLDL